MDLRQWYTLYRSPDRSSLTDASASKLTGRVNGPEILSGVEFSGSAMTGGEMGGGGVVLVRKDVG